MKFIRLATIAALSTTVFTGGLTAFADETDPETPEETSSMEVRSVTTDGQVQFTASEDEELVVIPPETGPEVEIGPEVPGTTGPLSIVKAATMNFGSQVISNQDMHYKMVAERQQLRGTEGEENKVPYVSFAQVQDTRGTNAGWDLQVSLSNFTSNTQNNVLTGAHVELVDSRIQYEGSNDQNAPVVHENGLRLVPNGGAQRLMTAAQGKGAGASSVVWGNQADLDAQFADDDVDVVENNAIQLFVPGSTAKDATTYRSTLTWELTTTPDEDGPEEVDPEEETV